MSNKQPNLPLVEKPEPIAPPLAQTIFRVPTSTSDKQSPHPPLVETGPKVLSLSEITEAYMFFSDDHLLRFFDKIGSKFGKSAEHTNEFSFDSDTRKSFVIAFRASRDYDGYEITISRRNNSLQQVFFGLKREDTDGKFPKPFKMKRFFTNHTIKALSKLYILLRKELKVNGVNV